MTRTLLAAALCLAAGGAWGQATVNSPKCGTPEAEHAMSCISDMPMTFYSPPAIMPCGFFGQSACEITPAPDAALNRAMAICERHVDDSGWEECKSVHAIVFNKQRRDRLERDSADREFLRKFLEGK